MILISAGLVLAAVVLLIAGFIMAEPFLIMWSIVVSVLSALFLVIGAFLRRHELFPGGGGAGAKTPQANAPMVTPTAITPAGAATAPTMPHQQPPRPLTPASPVPSGMGPRPATAPGAPPRPAAGAPRGISPDAIVLVIPGRKRYHVAGCRQLAGREYEELTFEEAREEGFTPCTTCLPDAALGGRQVPPAAEPRQGQPAGRAPYTAAQGPRDTAPAGRPASSAPPAGAASPAGAVSPAGAASPVEAASPAEAAPARERESAAQTGSRPPAGGPGAPASTDDKDSPQGRPAGAKPTSTPSAGAPETAASTQATPTAGSTTSDDTSATSDSTSTASHGTSATSGGTSATSGGTSAASDGASAASGGKAEAASAEPAASVGKPATPGGRPATSAGKPGTSGGAEFAPGGDEEPSPGKAKTPTEKVGTPAGKVGTSADKVETSADKVGSAAEKAGPADGKAAGAAGRPQPSGKAAQSAPAEAEDDERDTAPGGLPLPPAMPGRLVAGVPGSAQRKPAVQEEQAADEDTATQQTQRLCPPAGAASSGPEPESEPEAERPGGKSATSRGGWFDRPESMAQEPVEPEVTAPGRAGPPVASGPTPPAPGTAGGAEKGESANDTVRLDRPGIVKVIGGTKRFHNSSCPLVRAAEASGVLSMPRAEAEAKGLTPCSVCMHEHQTVG
ncbi:hypothetical protein [Nonomuraea sp. NPDC003754]